MSSSPHLVTQLKRPTWLPPAAGPSAPRAHPTARGPTWGPRGPRPASAARPRCRASARWTGSAWSPWRPLGWLVWVEECGKRENNNHKIPDKYVFLLEKVGKKDGFGTSRWFAMEIKLESTEKYQFHWDTDVSTIFVLSKLLTSEKWRETEISSRWSQMILCVRA